MKVHKSTTLEKGPILVYVDNAFHVFVLFFIIIIIYLTVTIFFPNKKEIQGLRNKEKQKGILYKSIVPHPNQCITTPTQGETQSTPCLANASAVDFADLTS